MVRQRITIRNAGQSAAFEGELLRDAQILGRTENPYRSTFPTEIVRCRLFDGQTVSVFRKSQEGAGHNEYGHRGGVEYEGRVYQNILSRTSLPSPRFYGMQRALSGESVTLFLEYLEGSVRVTKGPHPESMRLAAQWIGRFHRETEKLCRTHGAAFLIAYDEVYYWGWARRALENYNDFDSEIPWLKKLVERYDEVIQILVDSPQSVIHGEYSPRNITCRNGTVYPVDWEAAAVGPGEIDLAFLIDNWQSKMKDVCIASYLSARFPGRAPSAFREVLLAAEIYMGFRWLGNKPLRKDTKSVSQFFETIRSSAEALGLL